jgi:L-lysine 6-transaminase
LLDLQQRHPALVGNARGRGLMCAVDLPDAGRRDAVLAALRAEHVLMLPCGTRTVRMRPALTVGRAELQVGLDALDRVLEGMA